MKPRGRAQGTLDLVAACHRILEEIQPATLRAVCYRLLGEGRFVTDMAKIGHVSKALVEARENGEIPLDWIVDETRAPERVSTWATAVHVIRSATHCYRRDLWQSQPLRVEMWAEKGTVRSTLAALLDEYQVTFRVMHGYASFTTLKDIAEECDDDPRPLIALYAGDQDPSGRHMSDVDLPQRLAKQGISNIELRRIAVDEKDLARLRKFAVKAKPTDMRTRGYVARFHSDACLELDALPPPELRRRVKEAIVSLINKRRWKEQQRIEAQEQEALERLPEVWDDIISGHDSK